MQEVSASVKGQSQKSTAGRIVKQIFLLDLANRMSNKRGFLRRLMIRFPTFWVAYANSAKVSSGREGETFRTW